ncbi:MAG: hypothetical protein PVJ67_00240 [Candidatus Pacearchaeota archaeon]|jgi:hypothetical protein
MEKIEDIQKRQKFALETHKDYVNRMHKFFGLQNHPGYCEVGIEGILSAGGFFYDPDTILVNNIYDDKKDIMFITSHECGHFLHPFARKEHYEGKRLKDFSEEDESLREMVTHLGSIYYWAMKQGKKGIKNYYEHLLQKGYESKSIVEASMAYRIFSADENLTYLKKIANADFAKSCDIIRPIGF